MIPAECCRHAAGPAGRLTARERDDDAPSPGWGDPRRRDQDLRRQRQDADGARGRGRDPVADRLGDRAPVHAPVRERCPDGYGFRTQTTVTATAGPVIGAYVTLFVIQLFVSALVTGASVKAVSDAYLDRPTGIAISLRYALRRAAGADRDADPEGARPDHRVRAADHPRHLAVRGVVDVGAGAADRARGSGASLGRSRRLVRKGAGGPRPGVLLVATIMVAIVSADRPGPAGRDRQPPQPAEPGAGRVDHHARRRLLRDRRHPVHRRGHHRPLLRPAGAARGL